MKMQGGISTKTQQTLNMEVLAELRMHYGAITELSKRCGFTTAYLYDFFNSDKYSEKIIENALSLLEELRTKEVKRIQAIEARLAHLRNL
jgi:hypothetical protein